MVPAFEVLGAVGNGVADIGHTASFYWQGKMPAAAFFTTVPFGLTPSEHVAWIEAGGGQALWDELYAPFGVKPFMAGNTGVCMGGWFRRELKSLADLRGLKLRSLGLGGEVYRRLGATPQTTPPAEILTSACNRASSTAPNSSGPAPTSRSGSIAWRRSTTIPASTSRTAPANASSRSKCGTRSPPNLQAIVAHACAAEANYALAEMERLNAQALVSLTQEPRREARGVPGRPGRGGAPAGG